MKTRKPWANIKITITISSDNNCDVWDINYSDGYKSISTDDVFSLKQLLEDFDY